MKLSEWLVIKCRNMLDEKIYNTSTRGWDWLQYIGLG
jgi:hypothetical protein